MPFERPTLKELNRRIQNDLASRVTGAGALLRRSVLRVLGTVQAGSAHLQHGHIQWAAKQVLPDEADDDRLARASAMYRITKKPPAKAGNTVTLTGTDGTEVDADTQMQRADGVIYRITDGGTIASGTLAVTVEALVAGTAGNCDEGTELTFVTPVAGVNATGVVDGDGLSGGSDAETTEQLRSRFLLRLQEIPQGGAVADYKQWTLSVAAVTRVWVMKAWMGPGTVGVMFVCDGLDPVVPDTDKVDEVQAYLDSVAPETADVIVFAPVPDPLNLTIAVTPNTAAVKAAVEASLEELIRRESEPGGTLLLSHIREAISLASGEDDYTLTTPAANVTSAAGHLITLGTITWA